MKPDPALWTGVCAGGFFAAAAVYLGNVVALEAARGGGIAMGAAMACIPVILLIMGRSLLCAKKWAPRCAVVLAAGFCAMHMVGLAHLFLTAPQSVSALARSLQWQLGVALLFLWLVILGSALRVAGAAGRPVT